MTLAQQLLDWYDSNKRDLPWRQDKDPYKIWVSEIMLQQTRVEAVKAYYERWIKKYPSVERLAAATEEDVVHAWQGLGYYSRARNLLTGVREVVNNYGGKVPDTRTEMETLSGVGEYTAGAIVSIAYNKKEAAVDGNVLRIFSRLHCIREDIGRSAVKKKIVKLVEQELPERRPGDFNQALMDLGSLVCIPKHPRCENCPIRKECLAYRNGCQTELPIKRKRGAIPIVSLAAAVIGQGEKFLLRRRPVKGLLAGMWEFPAVEVEKRENPGMALANMFQTIGQPVSIQDILFQTTHTFSHRQWDIAFYRCQWQGNKQFAEKGEFAWVSMDNWQNISFAGPHQKAASFIKAESGYVKG